MSERAQRPPLDCGHDHEWIDIKIAGSEWGPRWRDYRVEIEAIVADRDPNPRRPYCNGWRPHPYNVNQVVRPIRWRAFYKDTGAYVEIMDGRETVGGLPFKALIRDMERLIDGIKLLKDARKPGRPLGSLEWNKKEFWQNLDSIDLDNLSRDEVAGKLGIHPQTYDTYRRTHGLPKKIDSST